MLARGTAKLKRTHLDPFACSLTTLEVTAELFKRSFRLEEAACESNLRFEAKAASRYLTRSLHSNETEQKTKKVEDKYEDRELENERNDERAE